MTPSKSFRRDCENGAALVIALLLITLLGILVVELSHTVSIDGRAVLNTGVDAKNTNAAMGGIQLGMAILDDPADRNEHDSLDEAWAKEQQIEIGDAVVTVHLVDEASKLNINNLTPCPDDEDNELDRLAEALGLDLKQIGAKVRDWTDPDDDGDFEVGGASNRAFLCPDELVQFIGIDSKALYGDNGLGPYVTVWSDGKVNVNTAPEPVLRAVLPEGEDDMAKAIIARREREPFKSLSELQGVTGMSASVFARLEKAACVASSVFTVESTSSMGRMTRTVRAVVRRENRRVQMVYFEEMPPRGALSTARSRKSD